MDVLWLLINSEKVILVAHYLNDFASVLNNTVSNVRNLVESKLKRKPPQKAALPS